MHLSSFAGKIGAPIATLLMFASPASAAVVGANLYLEGALRSNVRVTEQAVDHLVPGGDRSVALAGTEESLPQEGRLAAYRGLGTWVDMYDKAPWAEPERAVLKMKRKGVTTLYLQTANYAKPRRTAIFRPDRVDRLIVAAHASGMKVVAWYLPSFRNLDKDWRRTKAALDFRTGDGQQFDSFGLDIESTKVEDIATRNRRLKTLSGKIRSEVGVSYPLTAIVPDVHTNYWPSFPYKMVDRHFDAFLPMGYFSYRVRTFKDVYRYTRDNIRAIRQGTDDSGVKIHPIGGIAGRVGDAAARGYVEAIKDTGVLGGSYYDFPITTRSEWTILGRLGR